MIENKSFSSKKKLTHLNINLMNWCIGTLKFLSVP